MYTYILVYMYIIHTFLIMLGNMGNSGSITNEKLPYIYIYIFMINKSIRNCCVWPFGAIASFNNASQHLILYCGIDI